MSAVPFQLVQDRGVMESLDGHQIIREPNDIEWGTAFVLSLDSLCSPSGGSSYSGDSVRHRGQEYQGDNKSHDTEPKPHITRKRDFHEHSHVNGLGYRRCGFHW
jgi:hypothetical protein